MKQSHTKLWLYCELLFAPLNQKCWLIQKLLTNRKDSFLDVFLWVRVSKEMGKCHIEQIHALQF